MTRLRGSNASVIHAQDETMLDEARRTHRHESVAGELPEHSRPCNSAQAECCFDIILRPSRRERGTARGRVEAASKRCASTCGPRVVG